MRHLGFAAVEAISTDTQIARSPTRAHFFIVSLLVTYPGNRGSTPDLPCHQQLPRREVAGGKYPTRLAGPLLGRTELDGQGRRVRREGKHCRCADDYGRGISSSAKRRAVRVSG